MTDEELGRAVGEIEDGFILKASNLTRKRRKNMGKKILVLVAALMAFQGLVAYTTGYRFQHLVGKYLAQVSHTVTPEGYQQLESSLAFDWEASPPYRVEQGQVYFTHDGSDRNITEFISANNCFLYQNVNFWGNGYIIAVGGTPENLGDYIGFFQGGQHISSVFSVSEGQEEDPYYTRNVTYKEHQWMAALQYEINIRDPWYLWYDSPQQRWESVDSQKPYESYKITVEKA